MKTVIKIGEAFFAVALIVGLIFGWILINDMKIRGDIGPAGYRFFSIGTLICGGLMLMIALVQFLARRMFWAPWGFMTMVCAGAGFGIFGLSLMWGMELHSKGHPNPMWLFNQYYPFGALVLGLLAAVSFLAYLASDRLRLMDEAEDAAKISARASRALGQTT